MSCLHINQYITEDFPQKNSRIISNSECQQVWVWNGTCSISTKRSTRTAPEFVVKQLFLLSANLLNWLLRLLASCMRPRSTRSTACRHHRGPWRHPFSRGSERETGGRTRTTAASRTACRPATQTRSKSNLWCLHTRPEGCDGGRSRGTALSSCSDLQHTFSSEYRIKIFWDLILSVMEKVRPTSTDRSTLNCTGQVCILLVEDVLDPQLLKQLF